MSKVQWRPYVKQDGGAAGATLNIIVSNYDGLWELIRADYGGRLVDVLNLRTAN